MSSLAQIKDVVQQFAEAFSATLKVNVEVFDQIERIAGTGTAKQLIGWPLLPTGIVKKRIYQDGLKKFIFDNPGRDISCQPCPRRNCCHYKKAVHAALEYNNEIIGIIGIVAENVEQEKLIEYNNYSMLNLVDKIANLITAKVEEHQTLKKVKTYAELMHVATNAIDKGMLILDNELRIIDVNDYLIQKLLLQRKFILHQHIRTVLPSLILCNNGSTQLNTEQQEIVYSVNNKHIYLLCTLKPININNELTGCLCLIEDHKDTTERAYATVTKQQPIYLSDIIGLDEQFNNFKNTVKNVSLNDSTILLTGETGTGKELFARAIHSESSRNNGPFVTINCGGIPETLLESELFGYEKGAFTGANSVGKHGKIFMANKGTLFLDEIEALPLYLQPKLLRVIESKEIERIGGIRTIPVDVRFVAATNVKLDEMVEKKEFREDLFYRLNVVALFIPPLRNRKTDILVLTEHFINKFTTKFKKNIIGLSDPVKHIFCTYHWPGNVRELQNAIEYAINMEQSHYITIENLPMQLKNTQKEVPAHTLHGLECDNLKRALDRFGWTEAGKIEAANYLGISRSTIYRKIKKFNL